MSNKKTTTRREPIDEYDCWCMDCRECIHWDGDGVGCTHPEKYINPDAT